MTENHKFYFRAYNKDLLGRVYLKQKNFKKAQQILSEAEDICVKMGHTQENSIFGIVQSDIGRLKLAKG